MKFDYYLGIDVSKDTFNACLIDNEQVKLFNEKFTMDRDGFDKLLKTTTKYQSDKILSVLESTSIYHINLFSFLVENKINAAIVNPLLISNFIKSISLRKSKTDKIDALRIAQFAFFNHSKIKLSKAIPKSVKSLHRERDNLSKDIARLKTEIKSVLYILFPELVSSYNVFTKTMLKLLLKAPGADQIKKLKPIQIERIIEKSKGNKLRNITPKQLVQLAKQSIAHKDKSYETVLIIKIKMLMFIIEQKNDLDGDLKDFVETNLQQDFDIITSIKGIGQTTAEKFLIEVGDINLFNSHKQLRAYIGTDPSIKQSGTSINRHGKISKRGNSSLRRTIWQMAVSVIRYCDKFSSYFNKKMSEGKKYKQAVIAVANKLIKTLYALLKNKVKYSPNYQNQLKVIYS